MQFTLSGLGTNHYGVYIRANAYHECASPASFSITIDSVVAISTNIPPSDNTIIV